MDRDREREIMQVLFKQTRIFMAKAEKNEKYIFTTIFLLPDQRRREGLKKSLTLITYLPSSQHFSI